MICEKCLKTAALYQLREPEGDQAGRLCYVCAGDVIKDEFQGSKEEFEKVYQIIRSGMYKHHMDGNPPAIEA